MLRPSKPKFYCLRLQKDIFLNFITLEDEAWITERMPNGFSDMVKSIQEGSSDLFLDVLWRFLDDDSKELILRQNVVEWVGAEKVVVEKSDYVKRLKGLIGGTEEISGALTALFASWRLSMPETKPEDEKKKKQLTTPTLEA